MLLFRDEEHVERWCDARGVPRGSVITLEQSWALAHAWYKDKLKADWRRHTPEETEQLLESIGLEGSFWSVR